MEPVEVSTPLEQTPPPVPEPVSQEPETNSLTAHAEQFNPPKLTVKDDERPRHRAKSQQATAADVPRINELTKKLREAEAEIARYKATPARVEPVTPSVKPAPVIAQTVPPAAATATGFPDPEPTLAQFADKDDPYAAWQRAVGAWDRKKERFEEQQASEAATASRASEEEDKAINAAYATRRDAFVATHPDFHEKLEAAIKEDNQIPGVLMHALLRDDNGPAILYHLLTHPVELDDMRIRALALPPTLDSVALLQRRLRPYASQAVTTGAAPSVPQNVLAPRPPTPVRTGPMKAGDEPPREGSVIDHIKRYDPKRLLK